MKVPKTSVAGVDDEVAATRTAAVWIRCVLDEFASQMWDAFVADDILSEIGGVSPPIAPSTNVLLNILSCV